MKPPPRYLAVLISLMGLGVPWPEVAFGQGQPGFSSSAVGVDAKDEAIRNVLGLQETPKNHEAARMIFRSKEKTKQRSRANLPTANRSEEVEWDRTVLGLEPRKSAISANASPPTRLREAVQAEQLARIRSILGFEARDDIASVHLAQRVDRAKEVLSRPAVASASTPGQQIKREPMPASSASSLEPVEVSADAPQLLSPIPIPTGEMIVAAIFGDGSAPKTPKRFRDEPLPMLADEFASKARRQDRRLPQLMLVPSTLSDEGEPSIEVLSGTPIEHRADHPDAIALATPSELTADYLDPLMPLLRTLRLASNQEDAANASMEIDLPISVVPGAPIVSEAANDEFVELPTANIDERKPYSPLVPLALKDPVSDESEAPVIALLRRIELPQKPILSTPSSQEALVESPEAVDIQIATRDESVQPDVDAGAVLKHQFIAEIALDEPWIPTPLRVAGLATTESDIPPLPPGFPPQALQAKLQYPATNTRDLPQLNKSLSARFDIFDPGMAAPISAETHELVTLREALSAWFDIFDPRMIAPRGVKLPIEDRLAARSTSDTESVAFDIFDGALLAHPDSGALFTTPVGLVRAQTLPNLATAPIDLRLNMMDSTGAPHIAASVPAESTIEEAMARRALATSASTVSREVLHESANGSSSERASVAAIAEPDEVRTNPLQGELISLNASELDQMRGGFETPTGLKISFGIERAVYINGNLVTTTSLNVSDLSKLSAGAAQAAGLSGASLGLIQNGPGNTFAPGQIAASSVATVIQNTLNDQKIQGVTLINATVNSLDLIRRSNVQSSILNGLTDSIRR